MSHDMSKCAIAYCFKTSRNLSKFLQENETDPSNYFLAPIKPRKNKKGEMAYPYNGSKVALCKIENVDVLAGGMKYCETTIDVASSSKGMEHFYASQRVRGEEIQTWVEEAMETDEDDFPELPEYKKPLTKAQVEQRKYAGAGKATQGMVDKLEKMLEERDAEIAEYKTDIERLHDVNDDNENLNYQIAEKDEEIEEFQKKITRLLRDYSFEKVEKQNLQKVVDTQKELIDEMKDYEMYKAFFERFSKASKAKEWIAEYQA